MTQIPQTGSNPYSMFKMPEIKTNMQALTDPMPQAQAPSKLSALPEAPAVQKSAVSLNAQETDTVTLNNVSPDSNAKENKNTGKKVFAAVVIAAAAAAAGIAIGIKKGKIDPDVLKSKIPVFGKKYKAKIEKRKAEEAARKVAEEAAKKAAEAERKSKLRTEANFAAATFGIGFIAKCFTEHMENEDNKKLAELAYDKEEYMRDVEIPLILEESSQYAENYTQKIAPAIEKLAPYADNMRDKNYSAALNLYQRIEPEMQVEFWGDTNVKKFDISTNAKTGALTYSAYDQKGEKLQEVVYYKDKPIEIKTYKNNELTAKARFMDKKSGEGTYMSHFFKYNPETGNISGTLVYDEENRVKTYLARDREGKLNKLFMIDPKTSKLCAVCLSDDGKKCTKKYFYDEDASLKEALLAPDKEMPKRNYEFSAGEALGVDLYAKGSKEPLIVPFNKIN